MDLPIMIVVAFITAVISAAISAVISSYVTYYFTRKMQLEAEWRKDKLKYYSQVFDSMTETMSMPEDNKKVDKQFAHDYNLIALVAPQKVTNMLFKFYRAIEDIEQLETHEEEEAWVSDQKRLLQQLVLAIRKDLRIKPDDDPDNFHFKFRSSLFTD
jgi:hypothetical protein